MPGSPYTILAIGDSAIWGNGLLPEHKAVTLIGRKLVDVTGRPVHLVSYAHSGASLALQTEAMADLPGGLNSQRPTITEQETCAAAEPVALHPDLILLDGCINEVGALHVAGIGGTTADIHKDTVKYCREPMRNLLTSVTRDFPNATVVVLSYWRIVSDKSNPFGGSGMVSHFVDRMHAKKTVVTLNRLNPEAAKRRERLGSERKADAAKESSPGWWDNSTEFYNTSHACLSWAIAAASGGPSDSSDDCAPPPANDASKTKKGDRLLMAVVPDDPRFAYGASKTHEWSLRLKFLWWVWRKDEFYGERDKDCRQYYKNDFNGRDGCEIDPIAHPNVLGARAYYSTVSCLLADAWEMPGLCDRKR
jgi:hypothetical protein